LSIKGQDIFARALDRLPTDIDEEMVEVIDEAIVGEFVRQRDDIPFYEGRPYTDRYGRHGGPLRNSLTSTTDPFHQAGIVGNAVEVRTLVEYAKYNVLPEPDERAVEVALTRLMLNRLRDGGAK